MKNLLLAISGAVVAWLVFSIITKEFEVDGLIFLILGTVLGFEVGKKEKATSN